MSPNAELVIKQIRPRVAVSLFGVIVRRLWAYATPVGPLERAKNQKPRGY